MDTQSHGSRTSLLGCPQSKLLALGALSRMEGPGVPAGDLKGGGSRLHKAEEEDLGCTEQVSIKCLLLKKQNKSL